MEGSPVVTMDSVVVMGSGSGLVEARHRPVGRKGKKVGVTASKSDREEF